MNDCVYVMANSIGEVEKKSIGFDIEDIDSVDYWNFDEVAENLDMYLII